VPLDSQRLLVRCVPTEEHRKNEHDRGRSMPEVNVTVLVVSAVLAVTRGIYKLTTGVVGAQ